MLIFCDWPLDDPHVVLIYYTLRGIYTVFYYMAK